MKYRTNQFIIVQKSKTCMSKFGEFLSEYKLYNEALESARHSNINFVPYQCKKCFKYHLKPQEFYCEKLQTECSCRSHDGNMKDSYKTYADAQKMASIRANTGVKLNVYKCPEGNGYHLTSHFYNQIY